MVVRILFTVVLGIYFVLVFSASILDHRDTAITFLFVFFLFLVALKYKFLRTSIFLSSLLFLGTLLQLLSFDPLHKTLPANLRRDIIVTGEEMYGVSKDFVRGISTDEKGFRTYDNPSDPSLVLGFFGASTTEEIYLGDSETWSARVAQGLRSSTGERVAFFNTALSGTRLPHQLSIARSLNADVYVFFIGVNDWNHEISYLLEDSKFNFWDSDYFYFLRGKISFKNHPINNGFRKAKQFFRESGMTTHTIIVDGLVDNFRDRRASNRKRPEKVVSLVSLPSRRFHSHLEDLVEFCDGKVCLVLDQPTLYRSARDQPDAMDRLWMTPPSGDLKLGIAQLIELADSYNLLIRSTSESAGIPFCPVADELSKDAQNFLDDVHLTEVGSTRLVDLAINCLKKIFDNSPLY